MASVRTAAAPIAPIALERWNRLSLARRFEIAQRVVRSRMARWAKRYPGLVSVGVGHKLARTPAQKRAAQRQAQPQPGAAPARGRRRVRWLLGALDREQICIRFVMARKWEDDIQGSDHPQRIAPLVNTTAVVRGRRLRLSIPTDVDQHAGGAAQAALDATDGIRVVDMADESNRCLGAFCCVVRDRRRRAGRYLLSCQHVLALSANSPDFSPLGETEVRTRSPDRPCGTLFDFASLGDGTAYGCDAALAELTVPEDPRMWDVAPVAIADAFDRPESLELAVPRSNPAARRRRGPVSADFIDIQFGPLIRFNERCSVRFEAVLRYRAATVEGDSGSAVVGPDATLYGMHFYQFDNGIGCAIPAYLLFRPGLFDIDIRL
jgi:hypothetical protein